MGNDGGSIPRRHELVKNAARPATISELKATVLESQGHAWAHCALSGDRLDPDTLASDWKGRLYNYESVLKGLMPSDVDGPAPDVTTASLGIKSLRDVTKLKVTKEGKKWMCPISMKELGPATKAVYIVPCGHVFAEVTMKEIQESVCPECSDPFEKNNVITILPTTKPEVERLQQRIDDLRANGLSHNLKKDKSEKKKKRKGEEMDKAGEKSNGDSAKVKTSSRAAKINNEFAASLTAKVMAEQEERNKRRKLQAEAAR